MLATLLCLQLLGQAPTQSPLPELKPRLDAICKPIRGRMGYALIRLKTGERIDYRGDERYPSASTIKTMIALEALRQVDAGKLKWTDKRAVPATPDRKSWELSQWSYYLKDGLEIDLDAWVNFMIAYSDNLATRVVREWVGPQNIVDTANQLGIPNTINLSSFPESDKKHRRLNSMFGMGMTTPNEMARLLEMVYQRKAASPEACEKLMRILSHQYWDDWIGDTAPVDVKVASKSGAISRSRSDTAIVFSPTEPYVLTIYTDALKDQSWGDHNEAHRAIVRLAGLVWNGLHPNRPWKPSPDYRRKFLPTGGGVEE